MSQACGSSSRGQAEGGTFRWFHMASFSRPSLSDIFYMILIRMNELMILKHLHNFSEFQYVFPICLLTLHFRSHKCLLYLLTEMETGWLLNGMGCHQMNFMIGICEKRVEMINFTLIHGVPQSVIKTAICLWHLKQRELILY